MASSALAFDQHGYVASHVSCHPKIFVKIHALKPTLRIALHHIGSHRITSGRSDRNKSKSENVGRSAWVTEGKQT